MVLARPLSRSQWTLIMLLVIMALVGCTSTGIALPYVARIETINPDLPGLEIHATAGGGGELEIINRTGQEVTLLNEQGDPYVLIVPDGTYELLGGTWVKTKDAPVYYCHDPRIVYEGPKPAACASQVVKQWTITGRVGDKTFTINGQTVYMPGRTLGLPMAWVVAGAALGCLGVLTVGIVIFAVIWKKRETTFQTRNKEISMNVSSWRGK